MGLNFLLEEDIGKWITISLAIVGFIILICGSLIIVLSKRREDVTLMSEKRADQAEKLLALKDKEIKSLEDELSDRDAIIAKLNADLLTMKSEYATVVGIIVKDLVNFWRESQSILDENDELQSLNARWHRVITDLDPNYFEDLEIKQKVKQLLRPMIDKESE